MKSGFAIHNSIRVNRDEFADRGRAVNHQENDETSGTEYQQDEIEDAEMKALRDRIASAM
jgi:hypothetical protein